MILTGKDYCLLHTKKPADAVDTAQMLFPQCLDLWYHRLNYTILILLIGNLSFSVLAQAEVIFLVSYQSTTIDESHLLVVVGS